MTIESLIDLIWTDLLEETSIASGSAMRQLSCGCLVLSDGLYLDLYVWENGDTACTEDRCHLLVQEANRMVRDSDTILPAETRAAEVPQAVVREVADLIDWYTEGWGERDAILSRLPSTT